MLLIPKVSILSEQIYFVRRKKLLILPLHLGSYGEQNPLTKVLKIR